MTHSEPAREAVDTRKMELPNGYYLFQHQPSDMTCSLHMSDGLHIGNLRAEFAGDFVAALSASPAPAAGRLEATVRRAKYLLDRIEHDDGIGIGEFDTMLRMVIALASPAAESAQAKLPPLTETMIKAACKAHYGSEEIDGIAMTSKERDWNFRQAFKRMWSGVRASLATDAEG